MQRERGIGVREERADREEILIPYRHSPASSPALFRNNVGDKFMRKFQKD